MYYVYVLESAKDKIFYTGFTENLKLRLKLHQTGKVYSTAERRSLFLVYYEACVDKKDAIHREIYLKTFYGKMFIKKRLKSYLTG